MRRAAAPPESWFWFLMTAAAVLRLVYLFDYSANSVFWDSMMLDADIYDQWARRITGGDWLGGEDVYTLPPLYPYFLAIIYGLFDYKYSAVYAIQTVLGLLNIALIHAIGRRVFGGYIPLIAAAAAMFYGSFMFLDAKVMSTTLGLTLSLALMQLLLIAGERQTLALWGACGGMLGLTALVRPETLLFSPFACWWIWRVTRRPEKRKAAAMDQYALAGRQPWFAIAIFGAFAAIVVSPVTLRNWVVASDWSLSNLISSQAGITFYQANNEHARGLYVPLAGFTGNPHQQPVEEKKLAEEETGRTLKRSEVTRFWMNKGLSWILDNPAKFIVLEAHKLQRFLGTYEYSTEYIFSVERESVRTLWLVSLPFALISSLAMIGLVTQAREGWKSPTLLLLLFVIANFLVVMMFYVSSRYRMPSAPYLILFAAAGGWRLVEGFRSPVSARRTEAWVYGAIAVLLFVILHLQVDESARVQEANVHYNAGNQYFGKERYEDAVTEYRRAVTGDDRNWRAFYNMGNTLQRLGRNEEAIESYRSVLEVNPRFTAARRKIRQLGGTP